MKIVDFVRPEMILPEMQARSKQEAIAELAQHIARMQPEINAAQLQRVLLEREQLASTAIGEDVAIPHGKLDSVSRLLSCVGRSRAGVPFDSLDGRPTHIFFVLLAPENSTGIHLKALARISRLFKDADFRARLIHAGAGAGAGAGVSPAPTKKEAAAEMYRIIAAEDAKY